MLKRVQNMDDFKSSIWASFSDRLTERMCTGEVMEQAVVNWYKPEVLGFLFGRKDTIMSVCIFA